MKKILSISILFISLNCFSQMVGSGGKIKLSDDSLISLYTGQLINNISNTALNDEYINRVNIELSNATDVNRRKLIINFLNKNKSYKKNLQIEYTSLTNAINNRTAYLKKYNCF